MSSCGTREVPTASSGRTVGTDHCADGNDPGNQLYSVEWKACLSERISNKLRVRLGLHVELC